MEEKRQKPDRGDLYDFKFTASSSCTSQLLHLFGPILAAYEDDAG